MPLNLRPYQTRAVLDTMADALPVLIVSPPGSGKTTIAAALVERYAHQALAIAPRAEIVDQLAARCACPARTVQSLLTKTHPNADAVNLLVVDEAHHVRDGNEWETVLAQFPNARLVGLTATPAPNMSRKFVRLVVAANYSELISAGHLVACDVFAPPQQLSGELAQGAVRAFERWGKGQAFAFAPSLELSRAWSAGFNRRGITAAHIDGTTPSMERAHLVRDFKAGAIQVLCNFDITTEGFDAPQATTAILGRPFHSQTAFLQATGRVLRPSPGKDRALVLDLTGCTHVHGFPTDDRTYALGEETKRADMLPPIRNCLRCGFTQFSAKPTCARCDWKFPRQDPRVIKERAIELQQQRALTTCADAKLAWLRIAVDACLSKRQSLYVAVKQYREQYGERAPLGVVCTEDEQARELARLIENNGRGKGFAIAKGMFK